MMPRFDILHVLSDGHFHSGASLGRRFGISRTAVWKHLRSLRELGVEVHAVPRKGYRLARRIELLDETRIRGALSPQAHALLGGCEIHTEIDSTNTSLMRRAGGGLPSGHACFAERQHAGRGRRGRVWISPFGANIYLSVLWRFPQGPAPLAGLGLAIGVAVARTVRAAGVREAGLKWPNDIWWQGHKLGGILLEIAGEAAGPCHVVAGVGLNVGMGRAAAEDIDQPWVDMETVLGENVPRNALAGCLLDEMLHALHRYERDGLPGFLEEWRALDVLAGRPVQVRLPDREARGVAEGVDDSGGLLVRSGGARHRYEAGEVSLRPLESVEPRR